MNAVSAAPVLAALPDPERRVLLERAVPRVLHTGEVLHLAGDRDRRVHVLLRGVIKYSARAADGRETILGVALAGDVVGDVAAIDGAAQPSDAIATMPCELLGFASDGFVDIVTRNAGAARMLARGLAGRTRWMSDTTLERTARHVPARLAGRLLELADMIGHVDAGAIEMELPLAQADLARMAGMCRESACKTLRKFKSQGVVDYKGRRLRILRPDVLQRIRCAGR